MKRRIYLIGMGMGRPENMTMEARMACGMGACYACVVHVKGETDAKNLRVCEEGPVFPTGKVIV